MMALPFTAKDYKIYGLAALALLCLWPEVSAGMALLAGAVFGLVFGNPVAAATRKLSGRMLAWSIVGLGAGMNLHAVAEAGFKGLGYTLISIVCVLALGRALGRLFRSDNEVSWLISAGTAICGGSAIAALAPVLGAKDHSVSVSLAVVFLLNACALFLFPVIGHHFGLSQHQFGLWSALAIHDTSSVVGAGMHYGAEALQVGTSVKLARALWIVPLVFAVQAWERRSASVTVKPRYPWFILGFLALAALVTFIPALGPAGQAVEEVSRRVLVATLCLIGAGINRESLRHVGTGPLLQGLVLWLCVSCATLYAVTAGILS
jgi:uncharacterized integral membrane protein (TIGR00698 family)